MVITSRKLKRGGRSLGDVVRSRSSCCIHSNGCRLIPNQAVSTRLVGRRRDFHVCRFTNGLFGLCYQDIYLQQFANPPKKPREDCAVPDLFLRTLLKLLAAASLNVKIIIALKDSKGQILTENKFKDPLGQIKAYFGTTLPAPFPSESMTKGSTLVSPLVFQFQKMGSFRRPRPRFMSSPVLTDLPRFLATRQSLQLNSNSAWNSVQTAVINVFKGGGLQNNELYTLNENVRRLLKSELGSFITDYFQNQLLAKGLLFIEEKVKLCEEENRIHALSEIWDHFFTETLPTLQAIFYPVQGQELTIRQIALLGFRDLILLRVKLGEILPRVQTKIPPSIVQMLLILQGVHEPTGPSKAFMQLEELVKQVVSPYLGLCEEHCFPDSTCALEKRYYRPRPKPNGLSFSSHPVATRQTSETALTPLTEQEGEAYLEKCGSIRRHTVANAHSDIQLLAMASMMHSGMVVEEPDNSDTCLLLQPGLNHRQCSSEPSIADGPEGLGTATMQEPTELNCTSVC